jgi:hypothetical protein
VLSMVLAVDGDSLEKNKVSTTSLNYGSTQAHIGQYSVVVRSCDYRQPYAVGAIQNEGVKGANAIACQRQPHPRVVSLYLRS